MWQTEVYRRRWNLYPVYARHLGPRYLGKYGGGAVKGKRGFEGNIANVSCLYAEKYTA